MKHIFKKLHHPNRSNELLQSSSSSSATSSSTTASTSSTCASDHRTSNSGNPPASPSTTTSSPPAAVAAPTASAGVGAPSALNRQQQDYYTSEEEYQMQLALALSVSQDSHRREGDSGKDRSPSRGGDSARDREDAAADLLSRQYWDYNVLDYEEKVVDGFYDVYSLFADPANRGRMPSLVELETNSGTSDFEVVIVNRKIDHSLQELLQIAHCIALDYPTTQINQLVQRLAELVTENMGGPVKDANVMLAGWMDRSTELRTSLHTSVLPIGSLKIGLSRHRALLFKVLADDVGIPCRLVRGNHYTGVEDDAVNIVKLQNECEFLVDLMGAPGTMLPADVLSAKDTSFVSTIPKLSKLPSLPMTNDSGVSSSRLNQLPGAANNLSSVTSSEKIDSSPADSGSSSSAAAGTSGYHRPLAIGTSVYKGGRGPNTAGTSSRVNVNVVPYNTEDSRNLFADLNPFQIKGARDALLKNFPAKNKLDEPLQGPAAGRPPLPLMWKNLQTCNEVPKENDHDLAEGLFPKKMSSATDHSVPSTASIMSTTPEKIKSADRVSALKPTEVAFDQMTFGEDKGIIRADAYKDERIPGYDNLQKARGNEKKNAQHHHRENKQDRIVGVNSKLKDPESPGSSSFSVDLVTPQIDPVIDDVGDCEIPWEDLVIGERIGLGSYGEVFRADWNGTEVAVKKFLDQDFSGAALDEFRREIRIMQRLRHPNVVLFMGAVTRPPNLSIITEFLPRGSLYRIIHRPHCQIDEKRRIKMALDVAKGMNCLHTSTPTIVHRDLKSPNLLVDNNWNVKVCDFGLSRLKHNTFLSSKSTAGTPEWMAPEVLRNEPSNEKCDVYSFGVILWELATLRLPWSGMNPMQVVGAVGFQNRRLDIPKELDPLVARIIWECWQTDPNLRPSFAQLTVALKPLQRLVLPPNVDQPS